MEKRSFILLTVKDRKKFDKKIAIPVDAITKIEKLKPGHVVVVWVKNQITGEVTAETVAEEIEHIITKINLINRG